MNHDDNGMWLNANDVNPDKLFNGDNRFVFVSRNSKGFPSPDVVLGEFFSNIPIKLEYSFFSYPIFLLSWEKMIPYHTKFSKLSGTSYKEVYRNAMIVFDRIRKKSKRKPYIRSAYFSKRKVFFDYFWPHLWRAGGHKERIRRLRFFEASLDVLQHSQNRPETKENPRNNKEWLHRFVGVTREKELFYVQVKENKLTKKLHFISCFPV